MNSLKKLWQHRFFVSVSLSDTGAVRGTHIRAFWVATVIAVLLASFASLALIGDLGRARLAATVSGNTEVKQYLDQIAELNAEKSYQEAQVKTIAQELGLLQARLERFDALGEQLLSEEMFNSAMTNTKGAQGGPDTTEFKKKPSLSSIQQQIGFLTYKADRAEEAIETGIALSTKTSSGNNAPHFWPVIDRRMTMTSGYSWRTHPITKKRHLHAGTDIAAGFNAAVVSAGDGVIVFAGYRYLYGILVEIRHANGFSTRYAHLNEATVKNGDVVKAGELIGLMGSTGRSTGPHLHFELLKGDEKMNPYPFVRDSRKHAKKLSKEGHGKALVATWKAKKALAKAEAKKDKVPKS